MGIFSNSGGVLKTTLTTNLAGILSRANKVLIIDTSAQGDCMLTFGKNPDSVKLTLWDVLIDGCPAEKAIVNVSKNIDLLPSNDEMSFFEFDGILKLSKSNGVLPFLMLKEAMSSIKEKYDYILVDTPINNGLAKGSAYCFVDQVILPVQPEVSSMRGLEKSIKEINRYRWHHNPRLSILGVVATLVDHKSLLHKQGLQNISQFCEHKGVHFFNQSIRQSILFASSVAYEGVPSSLSANSSIESIQYFELFMEIEEKYKGRAELCY
ncbi:ParA family protein [Cohnella yongneupensis]|uniref:ParA family protein n=1 Tax=Cohnella yongneupensis TaxID=425006 RepID=A0ABW0R1X7_9BACL